MSPHEKVPISLWEDQEKPREKLRKSGFRALSDAELLAILVGTGTRKKSAVELSRELLRRFGGIEAVASCSLEELEQVHGIGMAKATSILTAFELCRRKNLAEAARLRIQTPRQMVDYLRPRLSGLSQEVFMILFLNRANAILNEKVLFTGGINSTTVDPKIIFREALAHGASKIVAAHNHPSGSCHPSAQDANVTQILRDIGKLLDIQLLDHIIITETEFYSFKTAGEIL